MSLSSDDDIDLAEKEQDLPSEIRQKKQEGRLRTGYTTGASAAAATKAALLPLLGSAPVASVEVTLPKGKIARLQIKWTDTSKISQGVVTSAVTKDGGDDPDVTNGAEICSTVSYHDQAGKIVLEGGRGVGRVTKPGLGLQIGGPAINPVPTQMIRGVVEELASLILRERGISVIISVPEGERIAAKTDNPRLGILGGISILGTTGIVLPYSTASFAASIRQSLDVAIAMGADEVVLTTGGRSEDFAKAIFTSLPDHCFIQVGDFTGYAVKQCAKKELSRATIAAFVGKLSKMAKGVKQTHVAGSHVDMGFLAELAASCGATAQTISEIRSANTARHVSEIVLRSGLSGFFNEICRKVHDEMSAYAESNLELRIVMFEFDGQLLGRYPSL
jgi:cobalt-precorrin-5B (C1)-methyltransferase